MSEFFFTGSQIYGQRYRTEASDIDIAVLVTKEEFELLRQKCKFGPLMLGNVNFVCFNVDEPEEVYRFERWRKITEYLKQNPPPDKESAISLFREDGVERQYFVDRCLGEVSIEQEGE